MIRHRTSAATPKRRASAQARALAAVRAGGLYKEAAKAAGVDQATLWKWRKDDAAFAAAFEESLDAGTDSQEQTLAFCVNKARRDPAYQTSLIFSLKNRRPRKWRDRREVDMNLHDATTPEQEADEDEATLAAAASIQARRAAGA